MIEIEVRSQKYRERNTRAGNVMRLQEMAIVNGGDFPIVFEQVVQEPLAPGKYELIPAWRRGRYGDLELNGFEAVFRPIKQ